MVQEESHPLATKPLSLCTLRDLALRRQKSGLLNTAILLKEMRFRGNNIRVNRLTYLKDLVERFCLLQC